MKQLICPDCGSTAELKDSAVIYGRSFGPVWICPRFPACQCFVGCHPHSETPLGTLANPTTRAWRKAAHEAFDPLWKRHGGNRGAAYKMLAIALGRITIHIGESDEATCRQIAKWATEKRVGI